MFCLECHDNFEADLLTNGKCPDCAFVINPQFSAKRKRFENTDRYYTYYICDSCKVELVSTSQFDNGDNHRDFCGYAKTLEKKNHIWL